MEQNPPLQNDLFFLDVSTASRTFWFRSQRCEVAETLVARFTKDMSASRKMKCFPRRQVRTNGASVGLVETVRHLPHLLRNVWWELRWALEATIRTTKHSSKCEGILRSFCV
jgi:hypothetical protein